MPHSSQGITLEVDELISQVSFEMQVPKEVLMRKKWLNALYHHVVFHGNKQDLPGYLLGWRYELLTQPLIHLLQEDIKFLSMQMKVNE